MAKDVQQTIPVRRAYQVSRGAVKAESGLATKYVACAVFDTAGNDSAGVSNKTAAAHGTGVYIPTGAIITNAFVDVKTTFQSTAGGTDLATIALMVQGAGDLVAAMAISDSTNVWDAGLHGTLAGSFAARTVAGDTAVLDAASRAASMIKLTAEREVTATVATAALTAGKLAVFVEYYIGL